MSLTGSCLCGEVAFTVETDKREGVYCHCRNCQRNLVGGGYFLHLPERSMFKLTKGSLKEYADTDTKSGRSVQRCFCRTCGTALLGKLDAEGVKAVVSIAALDQAKEFQPAGELFVDNALPGLALSEKAECRFAVTSEQFSS